MPMVLPKMAEPASLTRAPRFRVADILRARFGAAVLGALLGGCGLPETLEEACPASFAGDDLLEPAAWDVLWRVSCHRRFVGLGVGRVTKPAQRAAEAHAAYLEQNGVLDPASERYATTLADLFFEDPGWPSFTGVTALERLQAAEMPQALDGAVLTWDLFLGDVGVDPDAFFHDPYLRDVLFQPGWLGGGMATLPNAETGGRAGYLNLLFSFPSGLRTWKPVVYPREGQEGVPLSWRPRGPEDPLGSAAAVGFPITVTVGSDAVVGSDNPYELSAEAASLVDEDGVEVPLAMAGPGVYPWGDVLSTMAFAPAIPLRPGTTYTFTATVTWNIRSAEVSTTFTTLGAAGP